MSNGNKRPTVAVVLGILNIAFGVLGICSGLFALAPQFLPGRAAPDVPANLTNMMHLLQAVGLALSIMLIVSGIGLLLFKNWGRVLAIVYAIIDIPVSLAGSAVTAKTVEPLLKQMGGQIPPELQGPVVAMAIGLSLCCGLIYPIVLLILLNLKNVRAAFAASSSVPPVSPPNLGG